MSRRSILLVLVLATACLAAPLALMAENRAGSMLRFDGVIEIMPADGYIGTWTISDREVEVLSERTIVETLAPAEVGASVNVTARELGDGSLQAMAIVVKLDSTSPRYVCIRGYVERIAVANFVVQGRIIHFDRSTQIEGEFVEGALVVVQAVYQEDMLHAVRIRVIERATNRYIPFRGEVERISNTAWLIGGQVLQIDENTVIYDDPQIGDYVKGRAKIGNDGKLLAVVIDLVTPVSQIEEITFSGPIQRLPSRLVGSWLIGGLTVLVNKETVIEGEPAVGLQAEGIAIRYGQGVPVAQQITVSDSAELESIRGEIKRMSPGGGIGRWVVGDWQVWVNDDTEILGDPQVGATVKISGWALSRSLFRAVMLEVTAPPTEDASDTPSPDPRPYPDPQPGPDPSPSPEPDPTSEADPAPSPEPQPEPSPEPDPSHKRPVEPGGPGRP